MFTTGTGQVRMPAGMSSFFPGPRYVCLWFRMGWVPPNTRQTAVFPGVQKDPYYSGKLPHREGGLLIYLQIKTPEI